MKPRTPLLAFLLLSLPGSLLRAQPEDSCEKEFKKGCCAIVESFRDLTDVDAMHKDAKSSKEMVERIQTVLPAAEEKAKNATFCFSGDHPYRKEIDGRLALLKKQLEVAKGEATAEAARARMQKLSEEGTFKATRESGEALKNAGTTGEKQKELSKMFENGRGGQGGTDRTGKNASALGSDNLGGGQLRDDAARSAESKFGKDLKAPPSLAVAPEKGGASKELNSLKNKEALYEGASKIGWPVPVDRAVAPKLAEVKRERLLLESGESRAKWLKDNGKPELAAEFERIAALPPEKRHGAMAAWEGEADDVMRRSRTAEGVADAAAKRKGAEWSEGMAAQMRASVEKDPNVPARMKELAFKRDRTPAEDKEVEGFIEKDGREGAWRRGSASAVGERAAAEREEKQLRERDPDYFASKERWAEYVSHNREKVSTFKDGTQFAAEELGVDPARAQGTLTKKTYAGKSGLEIAAAQESRFESVDGTYVRQEVRGAKGSQVVEQDLKDGTWYRARMGNTSVLNPEFDYSKLPSAALPNQNNLQEAVRATGLDRQELSRRDAKGNPAYVMEMKDGRLEVQSADYIYKVDKGPDGNMVRETWDAHGRFGERPVNVATMHQMPDGKYGVLYKQLQYDKGGHTFYTTRSEDWKPTPNGGLDKTPVGGWSDPEGVERQVSVGEMRKEAFMDSPGVQAVKLVGKPLKYAGEVAVRGTGGVLTEAIGNVAQVSGGKDAGAYMSVQGNITRGKAVGIRSDEQILHGALDQVIDPAARRRTEDRMIDEALERRYESEARGSDKARFIQRFHAKFPSREAQLKDLTPIIVEGEGLEGAQRDLSREGTAGKLGSGALAFTTKLGEGAVGGQVLGNLSRGAVGFTEGLGVSGQAVSVVSKTAHGVETVEKFHGKTEFGTAVVAKSVEVLAHPTLSGVGEITETLTEEAIKAKLGGEEGGHGH